MDAHSLPFAKDFFDAVIAIDSFLYYGTDDRYQSYLVQFVKPGGFIGVVDPTCTPSNGGCRTGEKPGLVDVRRAEILPEGDDLPR